LPPSMLTFALAHEKTTLSPGGAGMQFLVAGHVAMTPEEREAWRTGALDPTPWQWLEDIPMFDGTAPPPMATAGRWLEEVADPERGGVSFVVDVPTRKGVVFMGLVDDEDLERWHQDLATVFLMAGRHNGKGEVAIFSAEAGVCFHIDIGPKGSVSL